MSAFKTHSLTLSCAKKAFSFLLKAYIYYSFFQQKYGFGEG